jgi:DNA repair photolyase
VGFFLPPEGREKVYVKLNAPFLLQKALPRLKDGVTITISTATDPYQPIERKYKLTHQILSLLLKKEVKVRIITKSALIKRDIEILRKLYDVSVGFTITTLDEGVRRVFEPYASPIPERLSALRILSKSGIHTWVFVAPILPYFFQKEAEGLLCKVKEMGAEYVLFDRFNYIKKIPILPIIKKYFPSLLPLYKNIPSSYFEDCREWAEEVCAKIALPYSFCW